jgi:hypothetical protein
MRGFFYVLTAIISLRLKQKSATAFRQLHFYCEPKSLLKVKRRLYDDQRIKKLQIRSQKPRTGI